MITPVDCDEHHGPETSVTADHADEATDFTQQRVLGQEGVSIYGAH